MSIGALVRSERGWPIALFLCAAAGHAYSLVVTGAKFWIDSIVYFQFAVALFDPVQLERLYDGEFGFRFQHSAIGLSFLIRMLEAVFHEHLWPALAILQYSLSAFAVTYFVLAFRARLSRLAQLAAVLLCSLHPYFTAFHGAPLTESISASLLLLSLGIAVRALEWRLSLRAALVPLLLLTILVMQFRPYLGMLGTFAAALIVFRCGKPWRIPLYAVTALAFTAGTLALPVYRAALGADFFLPNVSALLLTHVSYVAWDLDKEAADALKPVVLNDAIRAKLIGRDGLDYADAKRVFDDLLAAGATPVEARQRIAAAAWQLRTSSIWFIERQLQLPLASIGFQLAPVCCTPYRQLTRDYDAIGMFGHIRRYWRWNSGLDKTGYVEFFDRFAEMTRASKIYTEDAENLYVARIRPYVSDTLRPFRDPLRLTLFVTDPFVIVAVVGVVLCFWPAQRVTLLLLTAPFAVIYAAAVYAHIFGDNRHAHPLIPIIVVGAAKAAEEFFARRLWTRMPGLKRIFGRVH
jgi:hypothetical protein